MNKLRQSLRKKKPSYVPEASRPHQWQADEEAVRKGKCNFSVRYLGLVEVEESRGMHVCEEAVKKLKVSGKKTVKAVLWVSADGLRVVDDKTKDLIVDQTIEKVSFCAPDRNYDKAFSYICRDGTTRRWMCHCFMAIKDSGERLSHAVGCAFAACLERKQRREKECGVTASFDASRTSFVREGSFRGNSSSGQQGSSSERDDKAPNMKKDASSAVPSLPSGSSLPADGAASPMERLEPGGAHAAIPRRHAPIEQLVRQGSFRGFPALSQKNSPFKRQLSLRLNDLPSTLQRKTDFTTDQDLEMGVACDGDITALCSQINTSFTKPSEELLPTPPSAPSSAPPSAPLSAPMVSSAVDGAVPCTVPPLLPPPVQVTSSWMQPDAPLQSPPPVSSTTVHFGHRRTPSEAERWLEEVSKAVKAQQSPSSVPAPNTSISTNIPIIPGPPSAIPKAMISSPPMSVSSVPLIPTTPVTSTPISLSSMSNPTVNPPSTIQPFPLAFNATPTPAGLFGSVPAAVQPSAFVPVQTTYMPGLSYQGTSNVVPVVGITPSQMVANVFCTATPFTSSKIGGGGAPAGHTYSSPPQSAGFVTSSFSSTMNGISGLLPNGSSNTSVSSWPLEGNQQMVTTATTAKSGQEDERFEAKWAALETKSENNANANNATNAIAAANPFSNNLQKTFEIEL